MQSGRTSRQRATPYGRCVGSRRSSTGRTRQAWRAGRRDPLMDVDASGKGFQIGPGRCSSTWFGRLSWPAGAPAFASTKYRYRCRPKRVRIWSASSGQTGRQTPQETGGRLGIPQTPAVVNNKRPAYQPTRRVRREARPNVQGQAAAGRAAQGFGGWVGLAWTLHSTFASCAGGERTLAAGGAMHVQVRSG